MVCNILSCVQMAHAVHFCPCVLSWKYLTIFGSIYLHGEVLYLLYMKRQLEQEYYQIEENPDERFDVTSRYPMPNGKNKIVWDCTLFIEPYTSAYRDSVIHLKLIFPITYPFKAPDVEITTGIFHPYVHRRRSNRAGGSGILCQKILNQLWWTPKKPQDSSPSLLNNSARFCLETLYDMFVSEGHSLKNMINVCHEYDLERTREYEYMLFDKIIQRCLGHELCDDINVDERPKYGWSDIRNWKYQIRKQIQLDVIQVDLLIDTFKGKFPELQHITKKFLGIESGGIGKKDMFVSMYTFESIPQPTKNVSIVSSDNVRMQVPRWSSVEILSSMSSSEDIPLPFPSHLLKKMFALCKSEQTIRIRKYNPTVQLLTSLETQTIKDIMDILNVATFLVLTE